MGPTAEPAISILLLSPARPPEKRGDQTINRFSFDWGATEDNDNRVNSKEPLIYLNVALCRGPEKTFRPAIVKKYLIDRSSKGGIGEF